MNGVPNRRNKSIFGSICQLTSVNYDPELLMESICLISTFTLKRPTLWQQNLQSVLLLVFNQILS